jgi:hypothetical protein
MARLMYVDPVQVSHLSDGSVEYSGPIDAAAMLAQERASRAKRLSSR